MRQSFIPGPTWVDAQARLAMAGDMMGHRSADFVSLYERSQPALQMMAGTTRPMYLATCSSWGMMEAVLRNSVRKGKKVLNCCCGAFSDRWHEVALRCGLDAFALRVPWGESIPPESLRRALEENEFDLVTLVHAETSTGVLNPLEELAWVVQSFPSVIFAVDAVSSYSAVPLEMDSWGIDVLLAGTQKALALPPGMTVCGVSEKMLARAGNVENRGFYLDFLEYESQAVRSMTISTPNIPLVMGLAFRAEEIRKEGFEARCARHEACCRHVREWGVRHGWEPMAASSCLAPTLNCLKSSHVSDTRKFAESLQKESGFIIDSGYGEFQGKCIRISNMGVRSIEELAPLLLAMESLEHRAGS